MRRSRFNLFSQAAKALALVSACAAAMHITLAILIAIGLASCRSQQYVPVRTEVIRVNADSASRSSFRIDSVIMKDSVTVYRNMDSLSVREVRYVDRLRIRVDTVLKIQSDTIFRDSQTPVAVPVQNKKPGSLIVFAGLAIFLCTVIAILYKKRKADSA